MEQWEKRRDLVFLDDLDTGRVDQGLAHLGQFLGWSGPYGSTTPINEQKRLLFNSTYGNVSLNHLSRPELGDQKIIFTGIGFAPWVDWEGTQIVDYNGNEFIFPGVEAPYTVNGFPFRDSPIAYRGSALYFEEPPLITEANWDFQVDYVEPKGLWRMIVEGSGSFLLSSKIRPTETQEIFIEEWGEGEFFPGSLTTRFDDYYGSWGSKGTPLNVEHLAHLVGISGFFREYSLKIQPLSIRYILDLDALDPFEFNEIVVDGEEIGGRVVKGVENITNVGSSIVRVTYNGGVNPDFLFETVQIKLTDFGTDTDQFIDLTPLFEDALEYNAVASIKNSEAIPRVWESFAFKAGVTLLGEDFGQDDLNSYLRVPYYVERGGEVWTRAEKIVRLFSMFGKSEDISKRKRNYPQLPWSFYSETWSNFRKKRLFHEEYLISKLLWEEGYNVQEGFTPITISEEDVVQNGFKAARLSQYSAEAKRNFTEDGWVGGFYERVGDENLSGFFSKDLAEGKIVLARRNETPYQVPSFLEEWEEETNVMKVCYPYFTVGYSHPGDPVFDPRVN